MGKLLPLLQSKWLAAALGGVVFLGIASALALRAAKSLAPAPAAHEAHEPAEPAQPKSGEPTASWGFTNPEIEELVRDLREEKGALAKRREQMLELEVRLRAERDELTALKKELKQLQAEFDQSVTRTQAEFDKSAAKVQDDLDKTVTRVQDEEVANLKKLAKPYAAMDAVAAAGIMRELSDPVVVKIMLFMKETETAPVLEMLAKGGETAAKRAAQISERLRLSVSRKAADKPKS